MPTAEIGGQTLYYEEHGEGEPLLCVHGLSADTLAWVLQVPVLSERYRMVIFDNRDVGQSSYASASTRSATWPRTRLPGRPPRARELPPARRFDGRRDRPGAGAGGAGARAHADAGGHLRRRAAAGRAPSRGSGPTGCAKRPASAMWTSCCCSTFGGVLRERGRGAVRPAAGARQPQPAGPRGLRPPAGRQLAPRRSRPARLLSMPVHVIGGERDILVPVWKSKELAELIPGARLTVLERAPHGLTMERAHGVQRARARTSSPSTSRRRLRGGRRSPLGPVPLLRQPRHRPPHPLREVHRRLVAQHRAGLLDRVGAPCGTM